MRAVEDRDLAPRRRRAMRPPQEIVRGLLSRRRAKSGDRAALGVHGAQKMLDRPILAGRIEPLQADEERAPPLHVKHLLQIGEPLAVLLDLGGRRLRALVVILEGGVEVGEPHPCAGPNAESFQIVHGRAPLIRPNRKP